MHKNKIFFDGEKYKSAEQVEYQVTVYVTEQIVYHFNDKEALYSAVFNGDFKKAFSLFECACNEHISRDFERAFFEVIKQSKYKVTFYYGQNGISEKHDFITELQKMFEVFKYQMVFFQEEYTDYLAGEIYECSIEDIKPSDIFDDLQNIGIAFTTFGDHEDLQIQVSLNLLEYKLVTYVDGENVHDKEVMPFEEIKFMSNVIIDCGFEDFIATDHLELSELLENEQQAKKTGNGFEPTDYELERLNDAIVDYYVREFNDTISGANYQIGNLRFANMIPVAATETETGSPIDIILELQNMRLIADGENQEIKIFKDVEEMIEFFHHVDLELFTRLDDETLNEII